MKLVADLLLVGRITEDVDHCSSCLVFLTGSLSAFALEMIDSLTPESTRALTRRVLDCLPLLPAGMTSLKKIIVLKWTCLSLLLIWFVYPFY